MSPLTVEVTDAQGQPVPDAAVEVTQTRHRFWFGSAVGAKTLLNDARFADAVRANFNLVTFENDLKWGAWDRDKDTPLRAARWCQEHDVDLRGHNMVWPGWRHLPAGLKELQARPDDLRRAVLRHVEEIGTALSPYTAIWDVVNEPYDNHDLMDLLGPNLLAEVFRQARESSPHAKLFINDYGIVNANGSDHATRTITRKTSAPCSTSMRPWKASASRDTSARSTRRRAHLRDPGSVREVRSAVADDGVHRPGGRP